MVGPSQRLNCLEQSLKTGPESLESPCGLDRLSTCSGVLPYVHSSPCPGLVQALSWWLQALAGSVYLRLAAAPCPGVVQAFVRPACPRCRPSSARLVQTLCLAWPRVSPLPLSTALVPVCFLVVMLCSSAAGFKI